MARGSRSDRDKATATAEEPVSPAMRRVLEAMLAGAPVPPDAQAALTDAERSELAALARTSHLTRLSLNHPQPDAAAESASLDRARKTLTDRAASGVLRPTPEDIVSKPVWRIWWDRLTGESRRDDREKGI